MARRRAIERQLPDSAWPKAKVDVYGSAVGGPPATFLAPPHVVVGQRERSLLNAIEPVDADLRRADPLGATGPCLDAGGVGRPCGIDPDVRDGRDDLAARIGDVPGPASGSPLEVEEEEVTSVRCPGGSAIPEQIRWAPACVVGPGNAVGHLPRVRSVPVGQVDVAVQHVGEQAPSRRSLDQAASDEDGGGGQQKGHETDRDQHPDAAVGSGDLGPPQRAARAVRGDSGRDGARVHFDRGRRDVPGVGVG